MSSRSTLLRLMGSATVGLCLLTGLSGCNKSKSDNAADASANVQASVAANPITAVGSGSSDFCLKANADALAQVHSSDYSNIKATVAVWDAILADSPSDIHADVKTIDDFLHVVESGNYAAAADAAKAQDYATAATHIATYAATHCHK